jgi:hypothetical protein
MRTCACLLLATSLTALASRYVARGSLASHTTIHYHVSAIPSTPPNTTTFSTASMARTKSAQCSRAQPNKKQAESTATTKKSKEQALTPPSPLLNLTPELRNAIVRYVVVSDKPIKVQSEPSRRKNRHHFAMIPGLTMACKQLRVESLRTFFEENDFEIPPEMLNNQRSTQPLSMFATIHHNLGLELQTLQVTKGTKNRIKGDLFQLETSFALSRVEGGLSITNQVFNGTYLGRSLPGQLAPLISVCGCYFSKYALIHCKGPGADDLVQFLENFQSSYSHGWPSCNYVDMERQDEVVYRGKECKECMRQGRISIPI